MTTCPREQGRQRQPVAGVGHAAVNQHGRARAVTIADHVNAPPLMIDDPAARAREATPLEVFEAFMLECRQLVGRRDSIAVLHISLDLHRAPARPRDGSHYRSAVDVKRAADLYAQGRTLRQIGAELGVAATTVSHQLRRASVTMPRGGPPAYPAPTQQIRELRDQGLTWTEVAKQVDMIVSGAWSRYRDGPVARIPTFGPLAAGSRRRT